MKRFKRFKQAMTDIENHNLDMATIGMPLSTLARVTRFAQEAMKETPRHLVGHPTDLDSAVFAKPDVIGYDPGRGMVSIRGKMYSIVPTLTPVALEVLYVPEGDAADPRMQKRIAKADIVIMETPKPLRDTSALDLWKLFGDQDDGRNPAALMLDGKNVDFADIAGDPLGIEHTDEFKSQMAVFKEHKEQP